MALRAYKVCLVAEEWRRESTHFVKEIHQPIQLRSLKAGQILVSFIVLNQAIEVAREIWGGDFERVEVL